MPCFSVFYFFKKRTNRILLIIIPIFSIDLFYHSCFAQSLNKQIPHVTIGPLALNTNTQWLEDCFDEKITDSIQVVGLGEVSHGGIEPMNFQVKMIQYLVEKRHYRHVLVEISDFYYIRAIRNYLNNNKLKDNTIEKWANKSGLMSAVNLKLFALFNWLKKYNTGHPNDMVNISGFDVGTEAAIFNYTLNNYVIPLNPAEGAEYSNLFNNLPDILKLQKLRTWFDANESLLKRKLKTTDFNYLYFYIRNLELGAKRLQLLKIDSTKADMFRDSIMSENVKYLTSSGKSVLIAHNAHIVRSNDSRMGSYLDKYYRSRYYAILTDFSKKATIEVDPSNSSTVNGVKYIVQNFNPIVTTAPLEIQERFGITSGIFQHKDILTFRILDRTNNIDRFGHAFMSPARKNSFDSLVIFETITPGKN